jgi:hypothetical protein
MRIVLGRCVCRCGCVCVPLWLCVGRRTLELVRGYERTGGRNSPLLIQRTSACTVALVRSHPMAIRYHPLGRLCAEKRVEARCVAAVCAEARLCAEKCGCARRRYAGYREAQTGRRRRTRRTGGGATGLCVPVAAAVDDLAASMLPEQARDKWRCWFSSNVPTGGTHVRTSSSTVPVWHALTVLPGSPVHHPQTVDLLRVVSTCAAGCDCMDTTTAA